MRYLLISLSLLFAFCKKQTPENQLIVILPQTALRDAPGEKSRELSVLAQGEKVADLGKVSSFESMIVYSGKQIQAPWLSVKTAGGQSGWIFGGTVQPNMPKGDDWLLQKRMLCFFGDHLTIRRNDLIGFKESKIEKETLAEYQKSIALRDTLIHLLASRAEPNEAGFQPDFSWLQSVLPGFVFQYVAENTQPYLFADYRFWRQKALETSALQDDAFFECCLAAFPADSIESFFPIWKFQLSDYEAASQLGTGVHLKMLRMVDSTLTAGTPFHVELKAFKESILEDILDKNTVFWQPKELIAAELNQIISAKLNCLGKRDQMALQARLTMFGNPEANGVKVNLRSGK